MKYFSLIALLFLFSPIFSQEVQNDSFEDWEASEGPNEEPMNWSSIQTAEPDDIAQYAPHVLFKSTEAHSGDFSIRLINVSVFSIVANGLATNGKVLASLTPSEANVHTDTSDPKWHTECSTRPDSIAGYYKYTPAGNDITTVQALFHTGDIGIIPDTDSTGWVGIATFESPNETIEDWARFSAAVEYFDDVNPEYVLFNISGGDGVNAEAGSEAWYDDIELVYNPVGINENFANDLLSVYSVNKEIILNLKKFTAGESFSLEIYSLSGQLIKKANVLSGYEAKFRVNDSGVYICKLQSKDGLTLTKKVVVN